MSRITNFLKLFLPEDSEYYNVEKDQNKNFEKIDRKLEEWDTGKEPAITDKKSGFNLEKTSSIENNSNKLFTAAGAYNLNNKKWDIHYGKGSMKGIYDGSVGIYVGASNEINFEAGGDSIIFNYRTKKNGTPIEAFSFWNGREGSGSASATIKAGYIYQNGKQVANMDGSQYNSQQIAGAYSGNGGKQPPSYVQNGKVRFLMSNEIIKEEYNYKDWMYMRTYEGGDVQQTTAFGITKNGPLQAWIMQSNDNCTGWKKTEQLTRFVGGKFVNGGFHYNGDALYFTRDEGSSYWKIWDNHNFNPDSRVNINSISTSINDSSKTNVASAYLTNWLYERKKVKTAWSGKYLSTQGSQSVLCTLPGDWELCIIQYQWGSTDDLANHYCTAIITKYMKGISYHAPGSDRWGEARFYINGSNQFIPEGWHTEGNDCYILRVDYIL